MRRLAFRDDRGRRTFDLLQHGVKFLDNALQAMANVAELIDDVDDADKRSDSDKYLDRRYRKSQAYEALDHLLTTALDKSATLQSRLEDYHRASPELAHCLSRWQTDDPARAT
jgi:predicted  nucleic acid-binding Zn-ribbon protein